MKIRFGLQLDGQRGWHVRDSLGEITVGPNGMLGILEPQLGLIAEPVPQSRRVVQYLDALKRCDNESRFYHRSLNADELGTAATLLSWRDQWYLHGWNGKIVTTASRLADLYEVENVVCGSVAPSEGERLVAVLQAMKLRKPAIDEVMLTMPVCAFPKRWQEVLDCLPTNIDQQQISQGHTFLHQLQDRLRQAQAGIKFKDQLPLNDDQSVIVVCAETRLLASRWLAQRIAHGIDDGALVAANSAALLDDIMVAAGQARHGMGDSSAYRPALQLLPMTLALLWKPLDFNVLIEFLSHPISPVRSYARRQLAGKLAAQPGIGGKKWDEVLAKCDEHYGDDAAIVREQIRTWIEHPRFEQKDGVPINEVISRTKLLAVYFRDRLGDKDEAKRASWNAGFSQASAFSRSLEQMLQSGSTQITQRQLQKLLAQATSRGTPNPNHIAEIGSLAVVDNPAALIESFDQVVWWQPVMPVVPKAYPWSVSERQVLADSGVALPAIAETLENLATDWLKPILAANKQVVIVLPPKDAEVHPAWQMIEALVKDIPVRPLEEVFSADHKANTDVIEVPHTPLPQAKRWWYLPEGTPIPRREKESFSSLESFLFNPYQWLLRYPAGLKASKILSVSDGFLLDGQLAHSLVERFFALPNPLGMSEQEVQQWFDVTFPQVIETEGAVLLMHGRRSDYEELRTRLNRALSSLLLQFKSAGVQAIQSELQLNGHYLDGEIEGFADLVVSNAHGKQAIVDMKWGGTKKYSEKLTTNSHLQLGIYAELLRQKTGAWPDVAYYILSESKLFAQHDQYFQSARKVIQKTEESTPHLWERFKASSAWRNELLKLRKIEVALEGLEESEDSIPPENGLQPELLNPSYNDYLSLAGRRNA